ncbi:hypothetical protein KW805_02770 [Candidatus Pacearchaeota archaeon]|nr:hypothetical protein [Candidatus Pacearchaeota archaeon]
MTFFDIFSNKRLKEPRKINILVDHREKNSLVPSHLASQGIGVRFQQLNVADYLFGNIAIERKTINDLKSSIISKRINAQLLELKQYPKPLLLVEGIGNEDLYEGIINENALRGFLLSVALEYQVPIIFTQDEEDSARYIAILAKKKENKHPSLRASKITPTEEQRLQYILEGFPRIGPKTAKKLLAKFKTIKNIVNASEEDLQEILGKNEEIFSYLIKHEASFDDMDGQEDT